MPNQINISRLIGPTLGNLLRQPIIIQIHINLKPIPSTQQQFPIARGDGVGGGGFEGGWDEAGFVAIEFLVFF